MSLRTKLFADGIYTFAFRLVNMGLAAALGIVTARLLGPHGRGVYALPLVTFSLVTAAFAGLNNATAYFMLRRDAGRGAIAPALWSATAFVAIGIPAAAIVARTVGAPWAAYPAMLVLPAPAILAVFYGYQIGIDRVRMNTSYAALNTALFLTLMLLAMWALGTTVTSAITAWIAASDSFALGALLWLFFDARRLARGSVSFREFFGYAVRVGVVSLVSLLNYRADVYIVAAFGGPTLLGLYTLAVTAAEMLLAATQITAVVSTPQIGAMENERAAGELTARCVRNNVVMALVACTLLGFIAPVAVRLLYGEAFLPMIPAFRILLVGVFALSLGSPISSYFTVRLGKPQIAFTLASLSAIVCIVTSLLCVPRFGLVGAAFGSTLGYVVGQIATVTTFARLSGLGVARIVLPRWSDITAYASAGSALLRTLKRAA